jgi:hypothetical protein
MAMQVAIDVSQRLVIFTFSGELVDEDLLAVYPPVRSYPGFDPSFSEILDFTAVTATSVSISAIQVASRRESNFNPSSMHVIIAPQDPLFGLARMSQVFAENTRPNVAVVRTIEEARKVLTLKNKGSN